MIFYAYWIGASVASALSKTYMVICSANILREHFMNSNLHSSSTNIAERFQLESFTQNVELSIRHFGVLSKEQVRNPGQRDYFGCNDFYSYSPVSTIQLGRCKSLNGPADLIKELSALTQSVVENFLEECKRASSIPLPFIGRVGRHLTYLCHVSHGEDHRPDGLNVRVLYTPNRRGHCDDFEFKCLKGKEIELTTNIESFPAEFPHIVLRRTLELWSELGCRGKRAGGHSVDTFIVESMRNIFSAESLSEDKPLTAAEG